VIESTGERFIFHEDMNGPVDLRKLLESWPYDPENDARIIQGEDGRQILQVRTPLGIEQHEVDGRPDGVRPHGMESALEYFIQKYEQARESGREESFCLGTHDCSELFNEGTLYYYRYVRLFQLKDWTRTVRDTARNLRAFDFVRQHARREEDRQFLERWRPYILRVNASATAMLSLDRGAYGEAIAAINRAIEKVEALDDMDDDTYKVERERSLVGLRELLGQVQKNRPMSELEQLEHRLRRAIQRQEFEVAAVLRDKIRNLRGGTAPSAANQDAAS
jgi:hypothetical protein